MHWEKLEEHCHDTPSSDIISVPATEWRVMIAYWVIYQDPDFSARIYLPIIWPGVPSDDAQVQSRSIQGPAG